jgi:hypothetical protein
MKIRRGADFKISFTAENNGLVNFATAYTGARFHVRPAWVKTQKDIVGDPIYSIDGPDGHITLVGTVVTFFLTAAETMALPFDDGVYELELFKSGTPERVDPYLYGDVTVEMHI